MVLNELFQNGEDVFRVIRRIPVHNFKKRGSETIISEVFNGWKEYLGADKVLRQNETFLFCENITEAEILNENEQI